MTVQKNISGYILLKNKDDYYAPPLPKAGTGNTGIQSKTRRLVSNA